MLGKVLNSKLKKRILEVLFNFPERGFHPNELKAMVGGSTRTIGHALRELASEDVVQAKQKRRKSYYRINPYFQFYDELRNLIDDSKDFSIDEASKTLQALDRDAKAAILTGVFTFQPHLEVDMLLIGKTISGTKLKRAVDSLVKLAGQEINYTVFTADEFEHRKLMNDRFVRDLLDNPYLIVFNSLRKKHVLTK